MTMLESFLAELKLDVIFTGTLGLVAWFTELCHGDLKEGPQTGMALILLTLFSILFYDFDHVHSNTGRMAIVVWNIFLATISSILMISLFCNVPAKPKKPDDIFCDPKGSSSKIFFHVLNCLGGITMFRSVFYTFVLMVLFLQWGAGRVFR